MCVLRLRDRLKACKETSVEHATRPNNHISQAWATAAAITREISHPQFYVSRVGFRWATPPPLGRIFILLCYWAMIIYFMSWNAVKDDVYFWERIGYRNAWVTIMQLPFLFLLSMKFNIVGFLIGSSHERLNWLHRWVARTMLITATVHGWHFWTEWVRADFLEYELSIMPLVKYGLGAWGVLLFNVVVGFVPIRRMMYEIWLIQHVLSSVAMLVLLSYHIPDSAKHLLWMSVSFLVLDRAARVALTAWQNTRWRPNKSACQGMRRWGHNISLRAIGNSVTVLTIKDVHFKWHAGQHIYLWVPRLGLLESHPYTIACAHQIKGTCCCNSVQLIIRSHGGFSKRVHNFAVRNPTKTLAGFVLGPFGVTTKWEAFETLVLIGASTGASFTVPIMESVAYSEHASCVRRLEMALTARTAEEMEYYVERARDAARSAQEKGIEVRLHVSITGSYSDADSGVPLVRFGQGSRDEATSGSTKEEATDVYSGRSVEDGLRPRRRTSSSSASRNSAGSIHMVREYTSRPDIEALLREPVEQAWGETAVVVCGGKEIVARTRNCVGKLSDERAVHKGTGAQGIYLHVEEYAF
ncbi:Flavoprotein transmembrane component [Metarhizium album ARSEF 1941]|uniref:ferric-chelate reductase (NADPH) n=1 Tax=Metarhizium album (strain ARSEF 1941) TaxID=1081103 RepID=A0A0B2X0G2_METAS|nr:Flavoprotein transmembrane component [Metarhizium album ARSEF 1941]KHN99753.1 Flavoprotein transmembrane component [Metarhizium album ARSEF 1941]